MLGLIKRTVGLNLCFLYKCIDDFIDIDIRHSLSFYNTDTSRTRLGQQVLPLRSVRFNSELAVLCSLIV